MTKSRPGFRIRFQLPPDGPKHARQSRVVLAMTIMMRNRLFVWDSEDLQIKGGCCHRIYARRGVNR